MKIITRIKWWFWLRFVLRRGKGASLKPDNYGKVPAKKLTYVKRLQ